MKSLLQSAKFLALDMASTIFFLTLYSLTKSIPISVVAGVALGIGQIVWEIWRKRPIETMQWLSLFLVIAGRGGPAHQRRAVRALQGQHHLRDRRRGDAEARLDEPLPAGRGEAALVPDIAYVFGFVWAGLMFVSAVVNIWVATHYSFLVWTGFMSAYALSTKIGLFLVQYTTMRLIAVRRHRAPARRGGGDRRLSR
ncbi:MAG: hypothetical protein WDM85_02235 [Caulobacteraceae bacterium]